MRRTALLAAALLSCASLRAQEYPSKPITMVVPFPPGGVAEIVGRPLASLMEKTLKQPVILINRPGAGGAVGMASVAKGPPDGYTILMGLSSISIFPVSDRINGKEPPYELKDFAPIALVTADPTVLVVRADGPYKTVKDFVEAAKAQPGKINYSSSGVYGTLRLAVRDAATSAEFAASMDKVSTPVSYLDAPEFQKYWERDAARLKVALEKIGKVEEK